MEEADLSVWKFYCEHANPFVRDFGLMPGLIARERLTGPGRDIFLAKMALIHQAVIEVRYKRQQEMDERIRSRPPGEMMIAEEIT